MSADNLKGFALGVGSLAMLFRLRAKAIARGEKLKRSTRAAWLKDNGRTREL